MNISLHEASIEEDILNVFSSIGIQINRTKNRIKEINLKRDIAANIQITRSQTGVHCGYLMVVCPEKMALQIGQSFFQMLPDDLDEETLEECVQEVLNMLGGNLQNSLADANLDIPELIKDENELRRINEIREKSDLVYEFSAKDIDKPLFQVSIYSI